MNFIKILVTYTKKLYDFIKNNLEGKKMPLTLRKKGKADQIAKAILGEKDANKNQESKENNETNITRVHTRKLKYRKKFKEGKE